MSKSIFKDEMITVRYINDFRNGVTDKTHPLYGGLSSNASIDVPAPLLTKRITDIFTAEELDALSKALPGEDLSPTSSFWKEYSRNELGMPAGIFPIFLKKEGAMFNKKDPIDYIKLRILEDCNIVANSPEEIKNKRSEYRFVMIKHSQMHDGDLTNISAKKEAAKLHTKYEKDEKVLRHVLSAFNKNVSYSNKLKFLQNETWKLLEIAPAQFVKVLSDEYLDAKIVLNEALRYKLVSKTKGLFYTLSGDPIRLDGENNDYEGAAKFLDSGAGQEYKLELEAKINDLRK